MGIRLVWVVGDDWEGIYVNNRLQCEEHRITKEQICSIYNKNNITFSEVRYLNEQGIEWLQDEGYLPMWLGDIPHQYFT